MTPPAHAALRARYPSAPQQFWSGLFAAYQTPPRHYHTIDHIAEVARHHDRVATDIGWRQPVEVLMAILFHDAVYRVGARDNEHASAELAMASMRRLLPNANIDHQRVAELIELTAAHGRLDRSSVDDDAAHFLDCDTAILGAEPAVYRDYALAVAREYQPLVTAAQYRSGRRGFLQQLLRAPRIFLSEYFHQRLDQPARRNIRAELDELRSNA